MKVKDLFPGLHKPTKDKPKLIIANRAPSPADLVTAQWWYDQSQKTMYKATQNGYVKD